MHYEGRTGFGAARLDIFIASPDGHESACRLKMRGTHFQDCKSSQAQIKFSCYSARFFCYFLLSFSDIVKAPLLNYPTSSPGSGQKLPEPLSQSIYEFLHAPYLYVYLVLVREMNNVEMISVSFYSPGCSETQVEQKRIAINYECVISSHPSLSQRRCLKNIYN